MTITRDLIAAFLIAFFAQYLIPRASRKRPRRALRDAVHASHALAVSDPELQAEMRELNNN